MKSVTFKLPPTDHWLKFMLWGVSDYDRVRAMSLMSEKVKYAKAGVTMWNGAKAYYMGVGKWQVSGYAWDGSDTDEVVARVISELMRQAEPPPTRICPSCSMDIVSHVTGCMYCGAVLPEGV